ncbi:MAG TPA: PPC domain-containing protein [Kiritimatiellia bacterium]|nr:PPC domain-containing protein [Kiritimatiellia bacterium]HPS06187.1 PPC domain-containing protein [Kiritimatiellia bacterium]
MKAFVSLILALGVSARAAEIGCVYPAGGAPGTTFDVSVRGQGLKMACGALVSGEGVAAALVDVIPLDPAMPGKRRKVPALQDEAIVRVTIDKNAVPGPRDFRLLCSNDVTVPLAFHIGRFPEITEAEPNDTLPDGTSVGPMPVCINGRITEQDADTFRFSAVKGQTLVAQVQGRALIPYLADAVPGWFQPLLKLFDAAGREIATVDDFRFDPDPILVFDVPATGEYALQLSDAINRGRDDFVYRLTLGQLPLVTGFCPMGGEKGENLNIVRQGVNLPPQKTRIFSSGKTSETCLQALVGDTLSFPALRFDLDALPEQSESEPNDGRQGSQVIPAPVIINGTIGKPGDEDVFRFEGKAGQSVAIETRARQLGSPLDTLLTLTDSRGKIMATHDDQTNVFTGLLTDHCDSAITARLLADSTYEVRVRDNRGKGGPEYHYRLRISEPRPNFELWVTPSSLGIPLGGTVRANVHVRRVDGFSGPITLQLDNPPLGISCEGGLIPANATESVITLSAVASDKRLPHAPFELSLSGIATNGTTVIRQTAVPAHRKLQAFYYKHLVPDQTWMANITAARRGFSLQIVVPEQAPYIKAAAHAPFDVTIAGGKARVQAELVTVRVVEPENGFIVNRVRDGANPGEIVVTLTCADDEYAPPKNGNLILSVGRKSPKFKQPNRPPPTGALTPAIPYAVE